MSATCTYSETWCMSVPSKPTLMGLNFGAIFIQTHVHFRFGTLILKNRYTLPGVMMTAGHFYLTISYTSNSLRLPKCCSLLSLGLLLTSGQESTKGSMGYSALRVISKRSKRFLERNLCVSWEEWNVSEYYSTMFAHRTYDISKIAPAPTLSCSPFFFQEELQTMTSSIC